MAIRASVFAVLLVCPSVTASANDILTQARESAMRIESADFVFESRYYQHELVRFRYREGMARLDSVDAQTADFDVSDPVLIEAFNGELYQDLAPGLRSLSYTRQSPEPVFGAFSYQTPLEVCYEWLQIASEDYHYDWTTYRNQGVWDRLQPESGTLERTVNGNACVGLEFKYPHGIVQRVFFDVEHGYFPVRSEKFHPNGVRYELTEVAELAELIVDGQTIWFPIRVSFQRSSREEIYPVVAANFVVKRDQLHINELLDESIFTLPTTDVDNVYDRDANELLIPATGERIEIP